MAALNERNGQVKHLLVCKHIFLKKKLYTYIPNYDSSVLQSIDLSAWWMHSY